MGDNLQESEVGKAADRHLHSQNVSQGRNQILRTQRACNFETQPGDRIFEVTELSSRAQAFVSSFYIVNLLSEKRYIAPRNVAISKSNRV